MNGIADTGFIVGFANRTDEHHDWAMEVAARISEPLLTCEAVLVESAYHIGDVRVVLGMIQDGFVALAFDCGAHLPQLEDLKIWRSVTRIAALISQTCASSA